MTLCWLCDRLIDDPPRIIGRIIAGQQRVSHLECWQYLGELDLDLQRGGAGPELDGRQVPDRP
jgi:hypothetical protein